MGGMKMTGKRPEVSVRWTVAAIALLFALSAAHAGTINDLNTTPAVVRTSTALLGTPVAVAVDRSEEHTSELQSPCNLVCRLLLETKKKEQQMAGYWTHIAKSRAEAKRLLKE